AQRMGEGEGVRGGRRGRCDLPRDEAEEHDRKGGENGDERRRPRVPLVASGLALAGAALGALGALLGALARDARTASLVAVLAALPIVFLGLVPREIAPAAAAAADAFPFAHALRFFTSALFDTDPWGTVARETGWLALLALVYAAAARAAVRRLPA
ncbi:MAG TPA: ABC transporter permease, partial [Gaiellaceae bacterium]|nr:ABC transporter permease [Gaiellaceae bacterium]